MHPKWLIYLLVHDLQIRMNQKETLQLEAFMATSTKAELGFILETAVRRM
jgi:hypothetical protein